MYLPYYYSQLMLQNGLWDFPLSSWTQSIGLLQCIQILLKGITNPVKLISKRRDLVSCHENTKINLCNYREVPCVIEASKLTRYTSLDKYVLGHCKRVGNVLCFWEIYYFIYKEGQLGIQNSKGIKPCRVRELEKNKAIRYFVFNWVHDLPECSD